MESICSVYVTASCKKEAMDIGEEMVRRRLAACCNVFDGVASFFWWEGKLHKDEEVVMMFKTREALFPELDKAIRGLHSYTSPCIVAYPVKCASQEYADWIISETS